MVLLLNEKGRVRYSKMERRIFALLPKNGKTISAVELMEKFYDDDIPFNGRNIMGATLRRLADKLAYNKETFRLGRTKRAGQHPVQWSIRLLPKQK